MSLPPIISIDPLRRLPEAQIVVPGSKSITNRALILAAQANGKSRLEGALWSDDTQVMVACLQRLGYEIEILADASEPSNRTLIVEGRAGQIPEGGTLDEPVDLFVGNAGTAARFLLAFLCLGAGCYRLHGVDRMHERPQAALVHALRQLGYRIDSPEDKLPLVIHGGGRREATCQVDISESSQFASALLLASEHGGWSVEFTGRSLEQSPYVKMTQELIRQFGRCDDSFQIEPDASSGSYFWACNALGIDESAKTDSSGSELDVSVKNWPVSGWQIDAEFPRYLNCDDPLSRDRHLGDSIMTSIVLAARAPEKRSFVDLGRLRVQECERVKALRTELGRCGIVVEEVADTLIVEPGILQPALIETYDDHRIAMCFSVLALSASGIRIKDPSCVKKTFPTFYQKLATPAPNGLGVTVRDGETGAKLAGDDLVAR